MKLKLTVLICSMVFACTFSIAQHGVLDNSFGSEGIVITSVGAGADICYDMAVQNDDKIVLVGSTHNGTNLDVVLIRYNKDGSLDNSYSEDGNVSVNLGADEVGTSVVVLPDGKILTAGYQGASPFSDFLILKFNSDGTLDMTFGTNGRITTDFGGSHDVPNNIMLTPTGKILVTGQVKIDADTDFAAAQYNADGTPDVSFGDNGKLTIDIVDEDRCYSSVVQPDGKIILFGFITLVSNSDFATIRCNADGSLDNTFGHLGKVITDMGADELGFSIALQEDGKIVVSGSVENPDLELGVVRYNSNGSIDNTFGSDGIIIHEVGFDYWLRNYMVIEADGKILIAGSSENQDNSNEDMNLVRLKTDGSLDNAFGSNGVVTTSIDEHSNTSRSIALQSDHNILIAGRVDPSGPNNHGFALLRYLSGFGLGIDDFSLLKEPMLIYPNPIQDVVILEFILKNDETISIDLFDLSGRLVQSFVRSDKRAKGPHKETLIFDASIPSGTYILTLNNGVGSTSIWVVK